MALRASSFLSLPVLLVSSVLAGCVQVPNQAPGPTSAVNPFEAKVLGTVASLPAPQYDRMAGANWWENFVRTYDYRLWGTPKNLLAAQYIASELTAAGYTVKTLTYKGSPRVPVVGAPLPTSGDFL